MANYESLKTAIRNAVYENGNNEVTGQGVQDVLIAIVNALGAGYQFTGVATPATDPGTPDVNVMYIAGAGTYPNFGATKVPQGSFGVFRYNGEWNYTVLDVASWADASNKLYYNTQAGNVAAKTIQADGFTLQPGGWLKVHFDNANEAANPTLNVNNTGAHSMTFNGRTVSATNSWKTGETVAFYYDNYGIGIWHGIRLVEYPDFINVNELVGQATPFASASAARTAIPQQNRKAGLNIAYLLSTGEETSQWQLDMFNGDDVTDWDVADNWKVIGPVSVSQNTGTDTDGNGTISIGGIQAGKYAGADKLIKLTAFVDTQAGLKIGAIYYNYALKLIRKKTGDGTYLTYPYYDGAIYTYNDQLYVWDGTNLVPCTDIKLQLNTDTGKYELVNKGLVIAVIDNEPDNEPNHLISSNAVLKSSIGNIKSNSQNLIDKSKTTVGSIFRIDGTIATGDDNNYISDYIPVKGMNIISNAAHSSTISAGNVYDSSLNYIRTIGNTTQYLYQEGDAFVRLSFRLNDSPNANYGETLLPYQDYNPIDGYVIDIKNNVSNLTEKQMLIHNILADIDSFDLVSLYAEYGEFKSGDDRKSFILPVNKGDVIDITGNPNITCCALCQTFPVERQYLSSDRRFYTNSSSTYIVGDNEKYLIVGLHDSTNDTTPLTLSINKYDYQNTLTQKVASTVNMVGSLEPLLNNIQTVALFCSSTIVNGGKSVIFPIKQGDAVTIQANNVANCWMFCDEYPQIGAYKTGFGRKITAPFNTDTLFAPSGTKYLMVNIIDISNNNTIPTALLINGYNVKLNVQENIAVQENKTEVATGQLYAIGTIESEIAATSKNDIAANYYVSSKVLNRRKNKYFNKNIVAINHDDVSTEDYRAIAKIYNKYGFNANFNYILSVGREPQYSYLIKRLAEDGNDFGLHAFLDESAWMANKMYDIRPNGEMTFFGDSFATLGTFILYAMDDLMAGFDLNGNYISTDDENAKSVLEWAEYIYNELVDKSLGYSTKGTAAEKFAADYTGTYPTKQQIIDGDFDGCGHFTKGLFKDCCSCCNYEVWDRILEASIAYIRFMYGIANFTACGPHGARYNGTHYDKNGFVYDTPDYNFLSNGQCPVYSSRLKTWTSFFDTLKRFGIKNCANYSFPEKIELETREGMFFGQRNIRSDFFDRPSMRASYLTLMGTDVHTPYTYTPAQFDKIWGDVDNWLKFAYENAGNQITKDGLTVTICDFLKNAIDRINYCKDTGKIPTLSFDTIWNTPACSVAFELLCQYCYMNDMELVTTERARELATSLDREWRSNYYPNASFTQTLLDIFGGSSTALSAYLPDGMRLLSNTGGSINVGADDGHRILTINGEITSNTKIYGLPEGNYKFRVNAKSTSGDALIKVFKRRVGDKTDDDVNTLITTLQISNSTYTEYEGTFDIPTPYKVSVDYTNPVSIISEGYENNVCIIEIRYDVPADGDLTIYEPKIELI